MKKRTAASTLMISLAAVAGCGTGDSEYVNYKNTAPSEFEQNQTRPDVETETAGETSDVSTTNDSGGAAKANAGSKAVDTNVKPVSHSGDATDAVSTDVQGTGASETAVKSIISTKSGLIGQADIPKIDNGTPEAANKIALLIPNKSFRRERGTEAVRVSYDDIDLLKVLNMEPVPPNAVEYFPEWLAELDGKRIRIRGWMYPTFISEGLTSFTMARDNGICCFQRMPKIYDVIFVKLAKGEQTDYIDQRPFDVEGTFHIDSEGDGSELPRLYKLEDARVLN